MRFAIASAALIAGGLSLAGPAYAQGTAAPSAMKGMAAPKTAKSKACSAQADQQGLHGKARKAFRNKCKHAA